MMAHLQRNRVGKTIPFTGNRFERLLATLLLIVLPLTATAQIRFDVFLGYDGILPTGAWFPVVCEVQNDGPGFDAVFELRTGGGQNDVRQFPLELPTGTLKRFVVPVHPPNIHAFRYSARLLDRRGKVRAEQANLSSRGVAQYRIPIVGAISRKPPVFPKVRNEDLKPKLARLQPQVFPDHPIALQGLNVIYLGSERALALRESQAEALETWLYGGGHLIVGVEQQTQVDGTEWLRRLLPCRLTGSADVADHEGLQAWLVSNDDVYGQPMAYRLKQYRHHKAGHSQDQTNKNPYESLKADEAFENSRLQSFTVELTDGEVIAGDVDHPLVIGANRGLGRVTLLTFSPELEPFLSWKNRESFWAKMADTPPESLSTERFQMAYWGSNIDAVFGAMIETSQIRKLPVGWLLLLLVVYLGVIGPLDRFWLKRINRQMLTWLTFPVYVAFFSLLIYFIGYKLRAGETEWNEMHLVDVVKETRGVSWHGRTYGAIYSPANRWYEFRSDEPAAAFRSEFAASESGRSTIEQRNNSYSSRVRVPVWTSQLLASDWWQPGDEPLTASLTGNSITLENHLDKPMKHIRLVDQKRIYTLGSLAAGQQRTLELGSARSQDLSTFVKQHSDDFQTAANSRRRAFGSSRPDLLRVKPDAAMAASFIEGAEQLRMMAPPRMDLTSALRRGNRVLLAWTDDHSPIPDINQFKPRRNTRDVLWRFVMPNNGNNQRHE